MLHRFHHYFYLHKTTVDSQSLRYSFKVDMLSLQIHLNISEYITNILGSQEMSKIKRPFLQSFIVLKHLQAISKRWEQRRGLYFNNADLTEQIYLRCKYRKLYHFFLNRSMFSSCFCSNKSKKKKSFVDEFLVEDRITPPEKQLLTMIYENLASRSPDRKLTQHNFMLFISLTGLWGDKLFKYFGGSLRSSIKMSQFLTGMTKSIRATSDQKIKILFNFIKDPSDEGIRYRQFLKMLYHFSKDQLKQILVNDGVFVHQSILPQKSMIKLSEGSTVHLKHDPHPTLYLQKKTSFEKAYEDIINQHEDPGTSLQFKTEHFTYKVDYINMISLTKEFARHVFRKYDICEDYEYMRWQQFKDWMSGNPKFFKNFFQAFRQKLWSYDNKNPSFLNFIEKQCSIVMIEGGIKQELYMMLVENILFFSIDGQNKDRIFRIVCLEGLTVTLHPNNVMEIKDNPHHLSKLQLLFESRFQGEEWLSIMSNFQKNYVQSKYDINEPIGTGRFSIVYKAIDKKTQKSYALKVINLEKLDNRGKQAIENQTAIMKILKCPSIVKHYETIYSKENIYISTEYIFGEDLFQYVKRNKRLDEFQAAFILGQIIQAVNHLHSLDIIHRDLKPENIMIQFQREVESERSESPSPYRMLKPKTETVKIIDLGFANYCSAYDHTTKPVIQGTPNYIAPQILLGEKPSFQNDTFAIGSILYYMLRGRLAFASKEPDGTVLKTVRGDFSLSDNVWNNVSEEAKDLVEMMLEVQPQSRISLKNALNHPWFHYANQAHKKRKDSTDHE